MMQETRLSWPEKTVHEDIDLIRILIITLPYVDAKMVDYITCVCLDEEDGFSWEIMSPDEEDEYDMKKHTADQFLSDDDDD